MRDQKRTSPEAVRKNRFLVPEWDLSLSAAGAEAEKVRDGIDRETEVGARCARGAGRGRRSGRGNREGPARAFRAASANMVRALRAWLYSVGLCGESCVIQ